MNVIRLLAVLSLLISPWPLRAQLPNSPFQPVGSRIGNQATSSNATSASTKPHRIVKNLRDFMIPFDLATNAQQVREVHLHVSVDRGQHWQLHQRQSPTNKSFAFRAPQDGEYWFAVRTTGRPEDQAAQRDLRPELIVVVDTVQPRLNLRLSPVGSTEIQAEWYAQDEHLKHDSLALQYQDHHGAWRDVPLSNRSTADGAAPWQDKVSWRPQTRNPQIAVRAVIKDQAGNSQVTQKQITLQGVSAGAWQSSAPDSSPSPASAATAGQSWEDLMNEFGQSGLGQSEQSPVVPGGNVAATTFGSAAGPASRPPANAIDWETFQHREDVFSPPEARPSQDPRIENPWSDTSDNFTSTRNDRRNVREPQSQMHDYETGRVQNNVPSPSPTTESFSHRDVPSADRFSNRLASTPWESPSATAGEDRNSPMATRHASVQDYADARYRQANEPRYRVDTQNANTPFSSVGERRRSLYSDNPSAGASTDAEASRMARRFENPTPSPISSSVAQRRSTVGSSYQEERRFHPRISATPNFELVYDLYGVGRGERRHVELWYTRDRGRSWALYGRDPDSQSPMEVRVRSEGLYGFQLTVDTGRGNAPAPPQAGTTPDVWVIVDWTKPVAKINRVEMPDGLRSRQIRIEWTANDTGLLDETPISLSYSDAPNGPWIGLVEDIPNSGAYTWNVREQLPQNLFVRIDVRDVVGNVASDIADGLGGPRTRIVDVLPIR